jgi:hypothetical protein
VRSNGLSASSKWLLLTAGGVHLETFFLFLLDGGSFAKIEIFPLTLPSPASRLDPTRGGEYTYQNRKEIPSPLRGSVALREKGRHSGGSRNPVFDFIQFFKTLDARFRWHDELRHSL